mgnify:CR=1 FL=1
MCSKIRNILLDRDGTLIQDMHYLSDPEQVWLLPGVGQGLQALQAQGCRLFLVTNQSGIGRGYFTARAYQACQTRLRDLLKNHQVKLTAETYCPHSPETKCLCRKPGSGQWDYLAAEYGLKANETVLIGDKGTDIEFAHNCCLKYSILVLSGKGKEEAGKLGLPFYFQTATLKLHKKTYPMSPDILAQNFSAVCNWILRFNKVL